jgi:hypothetical protein
MADFARLACAAAPAFGWTAEEMLDALDGNRAASVAGVVEANPVAEAVWQFMEKRAKWQGIASQLLMDLGMEASEETKRDRSWPRQAHTLSAALKRAAPALRRLCITVAMTREPGTGRRCITIEKQEVGQSASQTVTASQPTTESDGTQVAPPRDAVNDCDACDARFTPADVGDVESWTDDMTKPAW